MASFFRRCPANLAFLSLQCPILIRKVLMETKLLKLHQTERKNLWLDSKTFQKILVKSCCVTSFFCRCPINLTFRALQCPTFNQVSTHGSQTSQTKQYWNKKRLLRSKNLSKYLSLKLLRDVIFPSLPGQSDIPCFVMSDFESEEYPLKPNFSN